MRRTEGRKETWIPFWEQAERLKERIRSEYRNAQKESFESRGQELFYGLVYEYAERQKRLPSSYIRMLSREKCPVQAIWEFYRAHFAFVCREWTEIGEVLKDMRWYEAVCLAA